MLRSRKSRQIARNASTVSSSAGGGTGTSTEGSKRVNLYDVMFREEDQAKIEAANQSELKKQHISLFASNEEVLHYTKMLKACVHDVTETTVVVPHLNDDALVTDKLEQLTKKMEGLQHLFGYKQAQASKARSNFSGGKLHLKHPEEIVKEGKHSLGVQLSFQYEQAKKELATHPVSRLALKQDFEPTQPLQNISLTSQFRQARTLQSDQSKKKKASSRANLNDSFQLLGIEMSKKKIHHDYKSFATMGLKKFNKQTLGERESKRQARAKSKAQTIRLDLGMKPEKMEANADKIKSALEYNMHVDPMVTNFCEAMRKAERLPELELARQQEEQFKKHYMPSKDQPPQVKYVLPRVGSQKRRTASTSVSLGKLQALEPPNFAQFNQVQVNSAASLADYGEKPGSATGGSTKRRKVDLGRNVVKFCTLDDAIAPSQALEAKKKKRLFKIPQQNKVFQSRL